MKERTGPCKSDVVGVDVDEQMYLLGSLAESKTAITWGIEDDLSLTDTNEINENVSPSVVADLKDPRVPSCLYWTIKDVENWIMNLGFPYYRECFRTNFIDGKRLIFVTASNLPKIGIVDWDHIKIITQSVRELLTLEDVDWNRSISLPPRDELGMYLEKKSQTGQRIQNITFEKFSFDTKNVKWQPPLCNMSLILPH